MTNSVTDAREQRIAALTNQIEAFQTKANALAALADVIRDADCPVGRYAEVWAAVEARLRSDVRVSEWAAVRARDQAVTIQTAIDAAERWTPTRSA